MRFWWRATRPESNFRQLLKKETGIWGGSNAEEILRSKVRLAIAVREAKVSSVSHLKDQISYPDGRTNYPGISYLYYSVLHLKQSQNQARQDKQYLAPDTTFTVTLGSASPVILEQALYAFTLTSLLGGLGARSRRGAGCFSIEDCQIKSGEQNWPEKWMLDKLFRLDDIQSKNQLAERMREIFRYMRDKQTCLKILPNIIPHTHLCGAGIYIFDPANSWQDALENAGLLYKDFRQKHRKRICDIAELGFPVVHRKQQIVVQAAQQGNHNLLINRRASPVIVKVLKTAPDKYFPLIVCLRGKFLPDHYQLAKTKKQQDEKGNWKTVIVGNPFPPRGRAMLDLQQALQRETSSPVRVEVIF